MGGIVGKLSFDRNVHIAPAAVHRMLDTVASRGFHSAETARVTYFGAGIALGSSDRTTACRAHVAHNETGTVRAVADCELSNTHSLRKRLENEGHLIRSSCDAELIAHAYEEWGDACVEHLAGTFAFAIWDEGQGRLLLARDPFGMRSLAFALLHGDGVVFASDIKALLLDPAVGREWHPEAIDAYLALGFVPAPLTIYRRITKLEPAHTLVVDGRRLTTRRYWTFSAAGTSAIDGETADLVETRLRAAVAPLARTAAAHVLMSGGLISTAIAAMLPAGGTALTVGLEADVSDLIRIANTAAHLRLNSEIDIATIDAAEAAASLAASSDEPIADPAAVSQYAVCAAARRYADVALSGLGAASFWARARAGMLFDDASRHSVYTRRFSWQIRETDPLERFAAADGRMFPADASVSTANQVAAAVGLRLRYPFLDPDVVDLALMLREHFEPHGMTPLFALRQAVSRHLPAAQVPSARQTPLDTSWLSGAVASLVPAILLGDRFDTRGIFSRPSLRALWDEHRTGRCNHARRLWAVLMLELWFREFIDGGAEALPAEYAVLVRAA